MIKKAKYDESSNSAVINKLIETFIPLLPSIRIKLLSFINLQIAEAMKNLNNSSSCNIEIHAELEQWNNLKKFFGSDDLNINSMTRIFLKEGYVTFPKNYIVLTFPDGKPSDCLYAGVLAPNNEKYHLPIFLFFSNIKYCNDYDDELISKIYDSAEEIKPGTKEIIRNQSILENKIINLGLNKELNEEFETNPRYGLFSLPVKGDPLFWTASNPNYSPPDGAMIIRDTEEF